MLLIIFRFNKKLETSVDSLWGLRNPGWPRSAVCIREPMLHLTNSLRDYSEYKSDFFHKGRKALLSRGSLAVLSVGLASQTDFTEGLDTLN